MSTSPNLGLTLMSASQAQKETVFNEFLIAMDALFKGSVISASLTSPPSSPADGDAYIVGGSASGAWSGSDYMIAFFFNGWQFVAPPLKLRLFNQATGKFVTYQGTSTHWTEDPTSSVSVLGDLTNVAGSPTDGQVLTWDNTAGKWKPVTPAFAGQLIALSDVAVTEGPGIDGQALYWDNGAGKWKTKAVLSSVSAPTFLGLSDVYKTGASTGWVLTYDPGNSRAKFVNPTTLTSVAALNNVGDVSYAAGLHTGDVLTWNGAAWGPATYVNVYSFLGMTDGPGTMSGAAGKILRVNSIENALEYVAPGLALGLKLEDMTDVQVTPGSGIDGYVLYWKNTDSKWEAQALSWANLSGKPTLFSGNYADLAGKPTLFSGAYSDLTGKPTLFSGAYADLTGLPTLFSGNYADLAGKPSIPTKLKDLTGSVNVAENSGEDGKFLKWDNATGKWIAATASTTTSLAALTDVSMSPGSGTDGYVVYWDNATTKFKLKAASGGGGGSSTLATLTDVNVTEGAGIDGKYLKWNNATSKWVADTPSGGGGGGGGNPYTPPISTDFTAVRNNPNSDTLIDRSTDGIPSLALIPAGGDAGSVLYCALKANPMPGAFSLVSKLLTADYNNGSGWTGAGVVLHNGTAGKSVYMWVCANGQVYCADFTGWTSSSVNLGGTVSASHDIFLHLDYDGTNIKFGISKNGVDAQWPRSESLASHLGAITHVGLGWGQLATGATYIWEHFYIGTRGTSGITFSGGGGGGGSSTLAGDSDVSITSPTNGQVLTYDAGTSTWKNANATGGGTGALLPPQYELGPFAPPDPTWFTALSDGSGTATMTTVANRGVQVAFTSLGSGSNQAVWMEKSATGAAWSGNWAVTARIIGSNWTNQYPAFGIALVDSSGKLVTWQVAGNGAGGTQLGVDKWNSPGSYSANIFSEACLSRPDWLRIRYDGTNWRFGFSYDGLTWSERAVSPTFLSGLNKVAVGGSAYDGGGSFSLSTAGALITYYDDPDYPAADRTALTSAHLRDLVDVSAGSPANCDHLSYSTTDGKWKNKPTRYDLGVSITGKMTDSEILLQYVAPVGFKIPASATGSYAKANTAATGSTTVTIKKNGTSVGTIVWSASGTSGAFSVASAITLAAGDVLQLIAPSTPDGTLADIGITLAGTRT